MDYQYKVLFVCLGNICRSPMAETIMNHLVNENDKESFITCDSAGIIGIHAGEQADFRMRRHAFMRGYKITHLSRQIRMSDFDEYDLIISMDESVHDSLNEKAPTIEHMNKIVRMTDYCSHISTDHVPDPYYGGEQGFENVIDILEDACMGLLMKIKAKMQ